MIGAGFKKYLGTQVYYFYSTLCHCVRFSAPKAATGILGYLPILQLQYDLHEYSIRYHTLYTSSLVILHDMIHTMYMYVVSWTIW